MDYTQWRYLKDGFWGGQKSGSKMINVYVNISIKENNHL
jgi:hypothetical protein